jgi:hypothetical protein
MTSTISTVNGHKLHPPDVQFTNNNTIYLDSGVATEDQLRDVIDKSLLRVEAKMNKKFPGMKKINVVMRNNKPVGYTYVWFTNSDIYFMLLGKNPDGSERVEYIDDPTWTKPDEPFENVSFSPSKNWADLCEEEERYICPKIKKQLAPLMTLDPIEYVGNQRDQTVQLEIDKRIRAKTWQEGDIVSVPDRICLVISPAYVSYKSEEDREYQHDTVCATDIPDWINVKDIKNLFIPFTTDPIRKVRHTVKGVSVEDTYPFVSIPPNKGKRKVYVQFDRDTHDALFALQMVRKVDFSKTLINGKRVTHTLIFTLALARMNH